MRPSTMTWALRVGLLLTALPPAMAWATEDEVLEEVQVTGSRISRPANESPNPVLTISAADIQQSGLTNLTDILVQSPQLVGSITTTQSSGTTDYPAGVNLLNLRNLGTNRTLVLVNGRRHIAGVPGEAAVDVNTIPQDLLERVDVLTGGVSAIYGADGVSGVVNFITKRDFEGVVVHGQYGLSGHGDAGNTFASITAGQNFADSRGNVALSYEFTGNSAVRDSDRKRGGDPKHTYSFVFNPADPDGSDPALYNRIPVNDLRWANSSMDGAIDVDGDLTPDFRGGGQAYDLGVPYSDNGYVQGGSSTPVAGYFGDLQARTQKHVANMLGSFEFSDAARLFFEGKYARTMTWNRSQPTYDFYDIVQSDNPLMPAAIRNAIAPGAIDADFRDFGVIDENDPQTIPDGVLLTRDNFDLSVKGDTVTRDTVRSVLGIDGNLAGNTKYELSYTFGQSSIHYDEPGQRIDERFFAALDAVDEGQFLTGTPNGNTRCRIDLQPAGTQINPYNIMWGNFKPGGDGSGTPQTFTAGANSGCVPLDLFGKGVADPKAIAWINYRVLSHSKIDQHVVSGSLTGDSEALFSLPGGPIGWAVGAEYRKEKSADHPDPILAQQLLWGYSYVTDEIGSFDVKEAFTEVSLPLLRDLPAVKSLTLGAAVRLSDYSTVGKTTTWKTDLNWVPIDQISLRGTYSEAVRAPNITELFGPRQGVFSDIYDPCDIKYVGDGIDPALRASNCASILGALGVNPATFQPSNNTAFATTTQQGTSGGNANLTEERAKTWTAGVTLRPQFVPNLALTFDWYDIRLKKAISTPEAQDLINLCVDTPQPNNYCGLVTRLTANQGTYTPGFISNYIVTPQNVAQYTTSGADIGINWLFTPVADWGSFQFKSSAGYLKDLTFIALPNAPADEQRLDTYVPKWTVNSDLTWKRGPVLVNYGVNYFSKTRRFSKELRDAQPDVSDPKYFWYKDKMLHDIQAAYTWDKRIKVYAGINNLYNAKPDFASETYPNGWEGRTFYLGFDCSLNK
ncbi:MAG: TonB-dependent receptor [Pseudomonadota bacterium]